MKITDMTGPLFKQAQSKFNVDQIIDNERARMEKQKRDKFIRKSLKILAIVAVSFIGMFLLWIFLDLVGARNPKDCVKNVGLQNGDLGRSFSSWSLACEKCSDNLMLHQNQK